MAGRIDDTYLIAKYDGRMIAIAVLPRHAGSRAWGMNGVRMARRTFTRNEASTAMVAADRLAAG